MTELSKGDRYIVMAKKHGYTADELGNIYSPLGRKLTGGTSKSGHKNFMPCVVPRHERITVLWHRFVAYFFLGDEVFKHAVVRHLNDDPSDNRIENLKPGSFKENRNDIPKEKLSAIAKEKAPKLVERSRKLTDLQVLEMRRLRQATGIAYNKIADLFSVTTMTAYRAVNKQCWSNV